MKATILTITLAAGALALVACKDKPETTETTTKEEVSAGAEQIAEGASTIIEATAEATAETVSEAGAAVEAAADNAAEAISPAAEEPVVAPE